MTQKYSRIRIIKHIFLILFSVMALVSAVQGIKNGIAFPKDLLYNCFREALFEHSYSDCQFPFTFWMIFPLGLLPEMTARIVWLVCNFIFTGIIAWTIRKTFLTEMPAEDYIILVLMMISGGAWRTNLSNGQYNLAAIAFFVLSVYFSDKEKTFLSGLFLSMCIFKYQVTIPLAIYYLYKRRYKEVITGVVLTLVSLAGCSFWFGSIYNVTLKQLNESTGRGLGTSGDVDLASIFGLDGYILPLFAVGIILLLSLAYFRNWRKDDTLFICVALFIAWTFAYQRIYSFFPMIIPLGYAWEKSINDKRMFYKVELVIMMMLTAAFFWSRTVSDSMGIILERLLFYPAFAIIIADVFIPQKTAETP